MPNTQQDKLGAEALALAMTIIKRWEGLELKAYPDPATGAEPYTIGYGATGPDIRKGVVWTRERAESDLRARVDVLLGRVSALLTQAPTACQLAAMVSLTYNIGIGAFTASTLLRKFNEGKDAAASAEFDRWTRAAGKVMQGLVNRRADERALFDGKPR